METQKTMFYHGVTPDGYRFTIAGVYEEANRLKLGISLCTKRDHFCKKLGRKIAEGRMGSPKRHGNGYYRLANEPEAGKEIHDFIIISSELGVSGSYELKRFFSL
jgi:hypothetical protein